MHINMDEVISSLNQGKFFLELHSTSSGFTGIHVMKFFPSLMGGFGTDDERGNGG
jgi:hypothetical protein